MFQNAAIDIAIALALMYLMLSLTCTVVNEYIASKLNLRSESLRIGLQALLDDDNVRKAFYAHGLIAGTTRAVTTAGNMSFRSAATASPAAPTGPAAPAAPARDATPFDKHPSYFSTNTFVLALIGSLTGAAASQAIPSFADLQAAIQKLPASNLKDTLVTNLTAAQNDFDKFRTGVATCFDDSMDRLSGAYKRNLKLISIVVGCAVAIVLNADTFAVGRALWSDNDLRAQMVQVADSVLKTGNPEDAKPASVDLNLIKQRLDDADAKLRPLPIGWPLKEEKHDWWFWPVKVLGLFVTGLALSLGAPFWFDALSKFMNIRAAGVKPSRQT